MSGTENEADILISSLKKGDNAAFLLIYNEYWESLYAIGFNRLQSQADVEDIIQELFTDLWNKRESLLIKDNLRVYLFTAMKYKVIDHIRKRKLDEVSMDNLDLSPSPEMSDNNTDQLISFNELYHRLKESVENLPKRCKLVFKMSRELNMTSDEIAKELNLSKRTVETQIYKSLKFLKRDLSDYTISTLIVLSVFSF